jgi:hypothetical protein
MPLQEFVCLLVELLELNLLSRPGWSPDGRRCSSVKLAPTTRQDGWVHSAADGTSKPFTISMFLAYTMAGRWHVSCPSRGNQLDIAEELRGLKVTFILDGGAA